MPVSDLNPQYTNKQYEFRQLRDTISGMSNVKRSGSLYLPIPSAMAENISSQPPTGYSTDGNDIDSDIFNIVGNAPWNHRINAYSAYLQRARFPDLTYLLLTGLNGIAIKKDPEIKLPSNIRYIEENATKDGKNLNELFAFCISEVLSVGRVSLLLEVDENTNKIYINTYSAESFINWKVGHSGMDKSTETACLAVFQERCSGKDADEFEHDQEVCQLVLRDFANIETEEETIEAQVYNVQKYYEDDDDGGHVKIPTVRGKPLSFIPLVTINSNYNGFDVGNCPLLGVSDIAISIYQKDADMSNAEFLTCNPMLVTTGVQQELDSDGCPIGGVSFPIGSNITMNLPDTQAQAFYVEPNANCLDHMLNRIKDLKDEAVQYGASVLSQDKKAAEAADTVKIRQAGNSSNLRTIVKSVGEGITQILQYAYLWETAGTQEATDLEFKPNLDLIESSITPNEINAMLQSYLNNGISKETFVMSLKSGGVKLAGDTVVGELAKIDTQSPNLMPE